MINTSVNSEVSILRALKFLMATVPFAAQVFAMENQDAQPLQTCCPIVELRQYTLHPGKRDVLIDLFDRKFVESQEALGMKVIGQFRDLDNPNRFVWLRGFRDMCRPMVGSSSKYNVDPGLRIFRIRSSAARLTPRFNCVTSLSRCASPPLRVGLGCPSFRYPRPVSTRSESGRAIFGCAEKNCAASSIVISITLPIDFSL